MTIVEITDVFCTFRTVDRGYISKNMAKCRTNEEASATATHCVR